MTNDYQNTLAAIAVMVGTIAGMWAYALRIHLYTYPQMVRWLCSRLLAHADGEDAKRQARTVSRMSHAANLGLLHQCQICTAYYWPKDVLDGACLRCVPLDQRRPSSATKEEASQ
jgi:H+/Cl- antiporter ClcA